MTRQGKSEIHEGVNLGAGVVHTSMALAGLEAYNAGALRFMGKAGENKMTNKTKPQTHTSETIRKAHDLAVAFGHREYIGLTHLYDTAPELLEAAKNIIIRLENMTSLEFSRGGEKTERERLVAVIARAEGREVR